MTTQPDSAIRLNLQPFIDQLEVMLQKELEHLAFLRRSGCPDTDEYVKTSLKFIEHLTERIEDYKQYQNPLNINAS